MEPCTEDHRVTKPNGFTFRQQQLTLWAALLGWMFDGLEMGIFPLVARPALQDLLATRDDGLVGAWYGTITALFLLGAACGGLGFGWLGDRIGRVRAMMASIVTFSIFTGMTFWVQDAYQFAALRFLAALGMGGEWSLGVALVMESWPALARPLLAGLIGAAANSGFLLIAIIARLSPIQTESWRWILLVGLAPAALAVWIRWFVPESPRWIAKKNQLAAQPLAALFGDPLRGRTLVGLYFGTVAMVGTWGSVQWIPNWVDQLTAGSQPFAKADLQIVSAGGSVVGAFLGAYSGYWLSRRSALTIMCFGSLLFSQVLFRSMTEPSVLMALLTFGLGLFSGAFYGWLALYLPELFPTSVRATGQGLCYNGGRVVAACAAVGAGNLMATTFAGDYARAGAATSLVYFLGLCAVTLAPETGGRELPE